jgi:hypothetical protein
MGQEDDKEDSNIFGLSNGILVKKLYVDNWIKVSFLFVMKRITKIHTQLQDIEFRLNLDKNV